MTMIRCIWPRILLCLVTLLLVSAFYLLGSAPPPLKRREGGGGLLQGYRDCRPAQQVGGLALQQDSLLALLCPLFRLFCSNMDLLTATVNCWNRFSQILLSSTS